MQVSRSRRTVVLVLGILALLVVLGTYGYLYLNPQITTGNEAFSETNLPTFRGRYINPSLTPQQGSGVTPQPPVDKDEIISQCWVALRNKVSEMFGTPVTLRGEMNFQFYPNPCMYRTGGGGKYDPGKPCIQVVMYACEFKGQVKGLSTYPEGCQLEARIPIMGLKPGPEDFKNVEIVKNGCILPPSGTPTPTPTATPTKPEPTHIVEPPEVLIPGYEEGTQTQEGGTTVSYYQPSEGQTTQGTVTQQQGTTNQGTQTQGVVTYYSSGTNQPQTFTTEEQTTQTTQQPYATSPQTQPVQFEYQVTVEEEQEEGGFIQTIISFIRRLFPFF